MNEVTAALSLAVINTKLIDALKAPVQQRYPNLDLWWVLYVNFITGLGLTWLAQVNVFGDLILDPTAGVILTGLFVGGGSSLIYDYFTDRPTISVKATAEKDATVSVSAEVEHDNTG